MAHPRDIAGGVTAPRAPAAAPKVFVSYRREETAGHAGRLYDAIAARFGERNVFMDVAQAPGIDFVDRITEAVGACDVLLVVIGPRWAAPLPGHDRPRLADADDLVRREVETGLARTDVTVMPVLVAGARMPSADQLPASLRPLVRRNALELSDQRWRYDTGRLVDALSDVLEPVARPARRRPRPRVAIVAGAVLAAGAIAAAVLLLLSSGGSGGAPRSSGGGSSGFGTDDGVRVVNRYARLYGAKDLKGLRKLLSPDVVLKQGSKVQVRGADRVLERYRRELRGFGASRPAFDWSSTLTDSTQDAIEVIGRYAISADGTPREAGRFGVGLRTIGSALLIGELCFRCPDLARPSSLLH